jgi:TPP-dependent pyruvate/acetoin dehydrogenase alpha subunit
VGWRVCLSETGPQENPLIPNKKLRQMFIAMTEMRLLDESAAGLRGRAKARRQRDSTHGQEACRVSMAIDLEAGDLVSDAQETRRKDASRAQNGAGQMPWIEEVGDRLRMAMGAALAFKTMGRANVVVAYVRHGEASNGLWRKVLPVASELELPVIFVVLPERPGKKTKRPGANGLSARASECGVPGIPVDANDAVALYRVAQESIGRMRGGDGPVLVECVTYRLKHERKALAADPLDQMRDFLMSRKVATEAWLDRAGDALQKHVDQSETRMGRRIAR